MSRGGEGTPQPGHSGDKGRRTAESQKPSSTDVDSGVFSSILRPRLFLRY